MEKHSAACRASPHFSRVLTNARVLLYLNIARGRELYFFNKLLFINAPKHVKPLDKRKAQTKQHEINGLIVNVLILLDPLSKLHLNKNNKLENRRIKFMKLFRYKPKESYIVSAA